jgi:hypothetical protein
MARSRGSRNRPGLPTRESVVLEFTLTPPAAAATAAARRPARARTAYHVLRTSQVDAYDEAVSLAAVVAAPRRRPGENFRGTARRAAKISIADAAVEVFNDLKDLITSVPDEAAMTDHDPPITVEPTSNRVAEEQRNVRVRAFLYAASREDDNDFHLIVGRAPNLQPVYMTMEVSGLPPSNHRHRATLTQARTDYKAFFQDHPLGLPGASYDFYDPPIPVEIEGSLFFDMSHVTGGRPGPQDLRDDIPTIWEVHPITRIVFEP